MAVYTYDQFRRVLRKLGFACIRRKKHETWEKVFSDGTVLQVRLSHKGNRDIPKSLFYELLRQAGMGEEIFRESL
jgi:CRISPR/Cas system CSM-associated protein Csm2 small subunit